METDSLGRDGSSTPKGRRGGGDALTSEEMVTLLAWSHGLAPATADLVRVHMRDLPLSKLVWHGSQSPTACIPQRAPFFSALEVSS